MTTRASAPTVVRGLTKRYGDVTAVDDVSFDVPAGGVFAFLGTNGAGKSTTIGALTTVIEPDAGQLEVAGHDVRADGDAVRRAIGVVFQDSLLDSALTVRENLTVRARPYLGSTAAIRDRIQRLADVIALGEFVDRRYGRLSGGQRRRADIARALLVLLERAKQVVEPAGAVGVAAILAGKVTASGPTVAVLSGGNIDPLLLQRVVAHGLAASGRYMTLQIPLPDRPGQLARVSELLSVAGANVIEVLHTRHGQGLQISEVILQLSVETRGEEHRAQVIAVLEDAGFAPTVVSD